MAEHVDSYYAATANSHPHRPRLEGEISADVCVIGAGFTGISAALHLAERGYDVVLLEANRAGWGASGRNGGQAYNGQRRSQADLEHMVGAESARRLWDLGLEAVQLVCDRVARHDIACDLKPGIFQVAPKQRDVDYLKRRNEKLARDYGYTQSRLVDRDETCHLIGSKRYLGGELDMGCYHLHPLNLALGMAAAAEAAGARIFEQSPVLGFTRAEPSLVRTERGSVMARYVVVACNGYLADLEPRIAGRAMPINNFMLATEPFSDAAARALNPMDVAVSDTKFVVNYWRLSADRRLLFGGGETYSSTFPRDIRRFVRRFLLRVYPQLRGARIDYGWGGTLAITMRRLPDFGRIAPNGFYVQGYSGQGVALGNLAGKLIAEAVSGTAERFDVMASVPKHAFPGGTMLRYPLLVLGMLYYSMLDKL